ncbi:hypothetical protein EDB81DRAFT_831581 [Dactylonectria macrodidyma]|uniref:RING-type domain-containing protein n=1 Tax=Dactylonectria macrodidyma TaxID=307937 RepID=A0A9P9CZV7_9HYPO|nr:hypothetical protein EDB81DRAFT_831581 [Dactylonectria macrodidyma]
MDPLSIAASVAGLIALVGKVAEVSRELYLSVQKGPQLLARLTDELDTFHAVLVELRYHLQDEGDGDRDALRSVSVSCDETVQSLEQQLNSLREMFTKGRLTRLLSRSRFTELMSDIEAATGRLYAYKQSLTVALQLRVLKQQATGYSRTAETLDALTKTCQQLRALSLPGPVEQYIGVSETIIEKRRNDTPWGRSRVFYDYDAPADADPEAVHGPTSQGHGDAKTDDVDKIKSFGSFEDWLDSFSPSSEAPATDAAACADVADALRDHGVKKPLSSKSSIRVRVTTFAGDNGAGNSSSAAEVDETIELKMTDYIHEALDALHQRGLKNVRGFRKGGQMLAPLATLDEPIAVHITDGPSSYSLGWLAINLHERFDEFYDNVIRRYRKDRHSLDFSLKAGGNGSLSVRDNNHGMTTTVTFSRTLRVPEDSTTYYPPARLSDFPVVNMKHLEGKLPESMTQKTGVVVPMYPREALVLSFLSHSHDTSRYIYGRGSPGGAQDLAIKVLTGGINAISGLPATEGVASDRQDHITVPAQQRLDGFNVVSKDGRGMVRQFVSMPVGEGYSVESQITGVEKYNGLQLILAPPFIGPCKFWLDKGRERRLVELSRLNESSSSIGLAAGMRLRMSGKDLTELWRKRHEKALDRLDSESWSASGKSFGQNTSRRSLCGIRPLQAHEVLQPFLGRFEPVQPLVLEPVFDITITIKLGNLRLAHIQPQRPYTWSISPFMTDERLREIIMREIVPLRYARRLQLIHPARVLGAQRPVMLHEFAIDGDVITVSELGDVPIHTRASRPKRSDDWLGEKPPPVSPLPTEAKGWELGLGFGGWIYQDCIVDGDDSRWNWKRSRLLNVLLLNAVAFKSFTGFAPPHVPISFRDYVARGIPFHHVLPRSSVLGSEAIRRLDSVSETDACKGVIGSNVLHGVKPVQCALCETMLANTILRPCNHVFCSNCVQPSADRGESIRCDACGQRATHQIHFAGPMETTRETGPPPEDTSRRRWQSIFSSGSSRESLYSTKSMWHENTSFVSAISRAAMSKIISDLATALRDTTRQNGTPDAFDESEAEKWDDDFERTMLQAAAEQGEAHVVRFLLQSSHQSPADQVSALRIAVEASDLGVVSALARRVLEHERQAQAKKAREPANRPVHNRYLYRSSPSAGPSTAEILHLAAGKDHCEVVQLLLDFGFDANHSVYDSRVSHHFKSALARAARGNCLATARILFPVTEEGLLGNAAIHAAINDGHDVLDFILEQGLDANYYERGNWSSSGEWTLVHHAADAKCTQAGKTIEILVRYGADIDPASQDPPSQDPPSQGPPRMFRSWGPLSPKMSPVQRSIDKGNVSAFEALLSAGADVRATLDDGRTCLHLAAGCGCVEIGRRLLEMGFDPNARAENHRLATPLRTALSNSRPDFVRLLVAGGAVVENADKLETIDRLIKPTSDPYARLGWWDFELAAAILPRIGPQAGSDGDSATTPCDDSDSTALERQLSDLVLAAFRSSDCRRATTLDIFLQVMEASPVSISTAVMSQALKRYCGSHGGEDVLATTDSVMRALPKEARLAVVDESKSWTEPWEEKYSSYLVEKHSEQE